ncbi:DNA glycosylase [Aulographum hederae CBS 113979]|uniref:DNA glycosylase n=1 Tax=Aulographum hederae CBS 113979 TaxID=1176131 RepID=A0A6G1H3Z2_9PEZI|nr:DNA glycosylase [Aulographum hederae CBS 113979]
MANAPDRRFDPPPTPESMRSTPSISEHNMSSYSIMGDFLTPSLAFSIAETEIKHFAQQHPFFKNPTSQHNKRERKTFLSDVVYQALKMGLSEDETAQCKKNARKWLKDHIADTTTVNETSESDPTNRATQRDEYLQSHPPSEAAKELVKRAHQSQQRTSYFPLPSAPATPSTARKTRKRKHNAEPIPDGTPAWLKRHTSLKDRSTSFTSSPSPSKKPRPPPGTVSSIPFPSTLSPTFGLIQETLAAQPFSLLLAVALLNKTRATVALPVIGTLLSLYPSPYALSAADPTDLSTLMRHLGLQNTRAKTLITLASAWSAFPPQKHRRYRTLHYPTPSSGVTIKPSETLSDDTHDPRPGAYEIGHLPGIGPYALDSWRIFCRDVCRELAEDWNGKGAEPEFQPEWMRVQPKDKELRAFLRWMWLREGWVWDAELGEKSVAGPEVLAEAERGGVEVLEEG